jgi:hypothetical protein
MKKPKFFKLSGLERGEIEKTMWLSKYEVCKSLGCNGQKLQQLMETDGFPIPYRDSKLRLFWRESQINNYKETQ